MAQRWRNVVNTQQRLTCTHRLNTAPPMARTSLGLGLQLWQCRPQRGGRPIPASLGSGCEWMVVGLWALTHTRACVHEVRSCLFACVYRCAASCLCASGLGACTDACHTGFCCVLVTAGVCTCLWCCVEAVGVHLRLSRRFCGCRRLRFALLPGMHACYQAPQELEKPGRQAPTSRVGRLRARSLRTWTGGKSGSRQPRTLLLVHAGWWAGHCRSRRHAGIGWGAGTTQHSPPGQAASCPIALPGLLFLHPCWSSARLC